MSLTNIILIAIVIYVVIAIIVSLITKDVIKGIFWIVYILGDIVEAIADGDIDIDL